jgi:hypothetical protein
MGVWTNKDLGDVIEDLKRTHQASMDAANGNPEGELKVDNPKLFGANHRILSLIGQDCGAVAKDTDPVLDPLETRLKGGTVKGGSQEVARGSDSQATSRAVARARDSRMNGPTSPFSGCPDMTPGRAPPRAADGSFVSIDSLFRRDASAVGADVSVDDIFGKQPPTLANG